MSSIPPEVREIVESKFSSIEQLEIFLFLFSHRDRSWTTTEVAHALEAPPQAVGMRLFLLASSGLIRGDGARDISYRYESFPTLDAIATIIEAEHQKSPEEMRSIIRAEPRSPARQLADAFKVRK